MVYLDDIIVFGKNVTETMQNLELVFKRLEKANFKLKPKKCRLFLTEVEYLGHIVLNRSKWILERSLWWLNGQYLRLSEM